MDITVGELRSGWSGNKENMFTIINNFLGVEKGTKERKGYEKEGRNIWGEIFVQVEDECNKRLAI